MTDTATVEVLPPLEDGRIAAFNATEAGLAALRDELEGKTFDCSDRAQDAEARAARRNLVSLRTSIEERRKELKAPLLERGKKLDDEAKRITGEIRKLEDPIDQQIKAEEQRKADEKAARERAEAERAAKVFNAISAVRNRPVVLATADSHALELALLELQGADPVDGLDPTDTEKADAAAALEQAIASLRHLADAAREREAEAQRLQQERDELERQRREEVERQRQADADAAAERAKQAEADRLEREAEQARIDEERRLEQERIERENEAERQRLAEERAQLQREREAAAREEAAREQQRREAEAAEREATQAAQRKRWASRRVLKGAAMTDAELDVLVQLLMNDDPSSLTEAQRHVLTDWADVEARKHGFADWIDALHGLAHSQVPTPAEAAA